MRKFLSLTCVAAWIGFVGCIPVMQATQGSGQINVVQTVQSAFVLYGLVSLVLLAFGAGRSGHIIQPGVGLVYKRGGTTELVVPTQDYRDKMLATVFHQQEKMREMEMGFMQAVAGLKDTAMSKLLKQEQSHNRKAMEQEERHKEELLCREKAHSEQLKEIIYNLTQLLGPTRVKTLDTAIQLGELRFTRDTLKPVVYWPPIDGLPEQTFPLTKPEANYMSLVKYGKPLPALEEAVGYDGHSNKPIEALEASYRDYTD